MCENCKSNESGCDKSKGNCNCNSGDKEETSKCKSSCCSCQSNVIKKASAEVLNLLKADLGNM